MAKPITVTVAPGAILHVHDQHVDGLRAPDAEQLAANGIATASARPAREGEKLTVAPDVAEQLAADGAVVT